MQHTYSQRIAVPNSPERLSWKNIRKGLLLLGALVFRIGIFGSYRATFWKMALPAFKKGDIEGLIHVGLIGHHLIMFARGVFPAEGVGIFLCTETASGAKLKQNRREIKSRNLVAFSTLPCYYL